MRPRHFVTAATVLCLTGIALLDGVNLGGKFLLAAVVIAFDAVIVAAQWQAPPWHDGPPGPATSDHYGSGHPARRRPGEGMMADDVGPTSGLGRIRPFPRPASEALTPDDADTLYGTALGALIALEDPARDRAGEAQRNLRADLGALGLVGPPLDNARVRPVLPDPVERGE